MRGGYNRDDRPPGVIEPMLEGGQRLARPSAVLAVASPGVEHLDPERAGPQPGHRDDVAPLERGAAQSLDAFELA
jgi:hypothetical protein